MRASGAVAATLLAAFPLLDDRQRSVALATLVSKAAFAGPLLDAVAAGRVPKDAISAAQVRQLRGLRFLKGLQHLPADLPHHRCREAGRHRADQNLARPVQGEGTVGQALERRRGARE